MSLISIAEADERDALDDYIEAHVHGPLRLSRDIDALVLDPCYLGTEVEVLAHALPCPLEWHPGFRLHVDLLHQHPTYRRPEYVELGASLAREGFLTAAIMAMPHTVVATSRRISRRCGTISRGLAKVPKPPANKPLQQTVALPRCARSGAPSWTPVR